MKRLLQFSLGISLSLVLISNGCAPKKKDNTSVETIAEATNSTLDMRLKSNPNWKTVDSLIDQRLNKSALELVDIIFAAAEKENNQQEQFRAIMYQLKLSSELEENDFTNALNRIETLRAQNKEPLRQLLSSVKGRMIWSYYQNNRYRFYNRTQTVDLEKNDITTWDLKAIVDTAQKSLVASLENKELLQKTPLKEYSYILNVDKKETYESTPTLYDLLAHDALSFFSNDEASITRPASKFTVNSKNFWGTDEEYLVINTKTTDSLSNTLHWTKIMQDLTRFHASNQYPIAKARNTLKRLKFANEKTELGQKDQWYEEALMREQKAAKNQPIVAEINANIANLWVKLNEKRTSQGESSDYLVRAHQLCVETIANFPSSYGASYCETIKNSIEKKTINAEIEAYQYPNQAILSKIDFKNVEHVFVQVYEFNPEKNTNYYQDLNKRIANYKQLTSYKVDLPKTSDFNQHSTEISLQGLPIGNYFLVIGTSDNLSNEKTEAFWTSEFKVTNLAYTITKDDYKTSTIQVVNRHTGEPIASATVELQRRLYNYTTRRDVISTVGSYKTDVNGMAKMTLQDANNYHIVKVKYKNDLLSSSTYFYSYKESTQETTQDHLFTDRAIYRPGQTVYFKGIRLKTLNKKSRIAPNENVTVTLKDVNYQDVHSLKLSSNEYGSFTGSFKLPSSGLTGQMTLHTPKGSINFLVEEYKRPTFSVQLLQSDKAYQLGDKIEIKGKANAYAGNAVDHAHVSYVVKRTAFSPIWRYSFRFFPIKNEEIIVSKGNVTTDAEGNFSFFFDADRETDKKEAVHYNYSISVEVTDANGETRTGTKQMNLSDASLQLNVSLSDFFKNQENRMTVETINADSKAMPSKGTIRFVLLENKYKNTKRERPWADPDMPLMSEATFEKAFPHFPYVSVYADMQKKTNTVYTYSFDNEQTTLVTIDASKMKAGFYLVETITKDKDNKEVKNEQYIQVIDPSSKIALTEAVFDVIASKTVAEPGETIQLSLASKLTNQLIKMEVVLDGKVISQQFVTLNNEQKNVPFKIEESYRGNVAIHFSTFKYGEYYEKQVDVNVPYTNKQLQVSFETFRDKLAPGEQEEWRLRITGPKKEKVAAELLIAMYDASLEAFKTHSMFFSPFHSNRNYIGREQTGFGNAYSRTYGYNPYYSSFIPTYSLPKLNLFGYNYFNGYYYIDGIQVRGTRDGVGSGAVLMREDISRMPTRKASSVVTTVDSGMSDKNLEEVNIKSAVISKYESDEGTNNSEKEATIPLRSNFNETAFFLPQLKTDVDGAILVNFTVPESLTKWNIKGIAHTKDVSFAHIQKELVTQKELMVQTNLPRFMRTGDEVTITAKISNLLDKQVKGTAKIQLLDAVTKKPLDAEFSLTKIDENIEIDANQSTVASWTIKVPEFIGSLNLRVSAKTENHTDGEELFVPILTDKVLVTESLPLTNNGKGSKDFTFNKLVNSGQSNSLIHHAVTLEYTSNPAWYVIQALPYMMEYPYSCSEQIFTRYYANAIASNIVRSSPKIKEVFDQWKNSSPEAFLSNLEKNQQLKSVILEETPWVLQAKDQTERKKRVALLFDFARMDAELAKNLQQLTEAQVSNGGFPWFPGMRENRYITQAIVSGMGHLNQLGITSVKEDKKVQRMIEKAVAYIDDRILDDYNEWLKWKEKYKDVQYNPTNVQYLYARSFFPTIKMNKKVEEAYQFYKENTEKAWTKFNLNNQAMVALASHRNGNANLANDIMKSILERSISNEDMGLYWKENTSGYFWYQAPIETQALIIEALHYIKQDQKAINDAKIWLLRNKQTNDWKTTTATANASYALLLGGNSFAQQSEQVKIEINGTEINPTDFGAAVEAGTGYFQASWTGKEVKSDLGKVKVTRKTDGFSWGAMYWQYFESMDKVTSAATNLKLNKQLFVVKMTDAGEVIVPIEDGEKVKRGDKIRVRIELYNDRDMEFVHMKDYRAAGFEPVNVLSSYKRQDRLGYYESTKDVATHFFFDYLPKGTFVFEYDLRATHSGDFSNGFALIECMYAPEFKSHSNGVRVLVE